MFKRDKCPWGPPNLRFGDDDDHGLRGKDGKFKPPDEHLGNVRSILCDWYLVCDWACKVLPCPQR